MAPHLPPGPTANGWLGSLPRMRRDPIGLLIDAVHDYGEIVHLRMLNRDVVVLAKPEDIRHVLLDKYQQYTKQTPGFRVLRSFLADGLLTNDGTSWRRQRRIAQPAFHQGRIEAFARTMTNAADAVVMRWDADHSDEVNVTREMSALTLRIVGETLLSTDVTQKSDRIGQALTVALQAASGAINRVVPLPVWLPTPANRRLKRAFATLDNVVFEMIDRRRQSGDDATDLLSMLMEARDDQNGEGMSDRQLRDEVMTIFLAGHETTAVALGWTWMLLSQHPLIAHRLREELSTVLGGRSPSVADLPRLAYCAQTIKEAMRLFPPAWIISRCAAANDRIGRYDIPAGTIVFTSPYVTHRLPRLWDNPEGFDPDRFAGDREAALPPFAYFPFGGGPRQCIGNNFAMMEMILVVATIAQRCRLELVPGSNARLAPAITLRPAAPIRALRRVIPGG